MFWIIRDLQQFNYSSMIKTSKPAGTFLNFQAAPGALAMLQE